MRILLLVLPTLLSVFAIGADLDSSSFSSANNWYLLDKDDNMPQFPAYSTGDKVPIDCIQRRIDDGEHKFDEQKNIIFDSFPKCKETNDYLHFKYNVNEDIQCTVGLTDELFHLFQLYVHEDAPFSCRLPLTGSKARMSAHQEGISVPLAFNFRGRVSEAHIDIDNYMNVIIQTPTNYKSIVSAVGWSAGTNLTRIIIGDYLTLNFAVRWIGSVSPRSSDGADSKYGVLPFADGFYALPKSITYNFSSYLVSLGLIIAVLSSLATYYVSYSYLLRKVKKFGYPVPGDDGERGFSKKD